MELKSSHTLSSLSAHSSTALRRAAPPHGAAAIIVLSAFVAHTQTIASPAARRCSLSLSVTIRRCCCLLFLSQFVPNSRKNSSPAFSYPKATSSLSPLLFSRQHRAVAKFATTSAQSPLRFAAATRPPSPTLPSLNRCTAAVLRAAIAPVPKLALSTLRSVLRRHRR